QLELRAHNAGKRSVLLERVPLRSVPHALVFHRRIAVPKHHRCETPAAPRGGAERPPTIRGPMLERDRLARRLPGETVARYSTPGLPNVRTEGEQAGVLERVGPCLG